MSLTCHSRDLNSSLPVHLMFPSVQAAISIAAAGVDPQHPLSSMSSLAGPSRLSSTVPDRPDPIINGQKRSATAANISPTAMRPPSINPDGSTSQPVAFHRAPQACSRCRQQKLRCLGGIPCERCVKSGQVCTFKAGAGSRQHRKNANISVDGSISGTEDRSNGRGGPSKRVARDRSPSRSNSTGSISAQVLLDLAGRMGQTNRPSQIENIPSHNPYALPQSEHDSEGLPPPLHSRRHGPPRIDYRNQSTTFPDNTSPQNNQMLVRNSIGSLGDSPETLVGERPSEPEESLYEAPFRSLLVEVCLSSFSCTSSRAQDGFCDACLSLSVS